MGDLITLRIGRRIADELMQHAVDELAAWPPDTPYARDLQDLMEQIRAASPADHSTPPPSSDGFLPSPDEVCTTEAGAGVGVEAPAHAEPVAWMQRHRLGPLHLSGEHDQGNDDWSDAFPVYTYPAPVVPADQRAAIEALADRMWRVHPKDIHAAGYEHLERGGKYENPRAAWYADQIEALFKKFRDQVSPVVPAEGLSRASAEEASAGWTLDMEMLKDLRAAAGDWGYSLYLEAVEQIALAVEARLRSAPPVGARVKPLVWEDQTCGSYCWVQGLHYYTEGSDEDRDWYVSCMIDGIDVWQGENQPTRGECKALAQADYEARILAALLPAGEGE